ncbi:MAG: DM13 domain-containing protein [Bacteroidota bacterium]
MRLLRLLPLLVLPPLSGCIGTDLVSEVIEEDQQPARIEVTPLDHALEVGDGFQYAATFFNTQGEADPSATIGWRTDDAAIASIDATGWLTTHQPGIVSVYAEVDSVTSAPATLNIVADPNQIARIILSPDTATVALGATFNIAAQAVNVEGNAIDGVTFTWSIADENVATVNGVGQVTGVNAGSTQLTASADGVTSAPTVIRVPGQSTTGTFTARTGTSYRLQGTATLEELATGGFQLTFGDDFSTSNGPGLAVYLSTVDGVSSTSIDLGTLQSTRGSQTYTISGNVDMTRYRYVIIHCVPFNVSFGSAFLQ